MYMNDATQISGKVIIITGASSGIGRATASHLAGLGAKVVLGARREDRLKELSDEITAAGGEVAWKATDVTSYESVKELVAHATATFGFVDILINNAGKNTLGAMDKLQVDAWNSMIDVNIKGPLNGIAAVLPGMKEQGFGQIITTSSMVAHQGMSLMAVYNGTKAAIKMIHEGLRQEVGANNIRVGMVSPGAVYTEIGTDDDPEAMDSLMKEFEGLKLLDPMDVARAFAFAISQPAHVDINEVIVRPTAQRA
jgi:NADP-dependent 3-hydroxy acid dehydrogenase YdfG